MIFEQIIEQLENEWDRDGFLGRLRQGKFDPVEGDKFLEFLEQINLSEVNSVPKRFLSLIWYLPIFLTWQRDRVSDVSSNIEEYEKFITNVHNSLEESLGTP